MEENVTIKKSMNLPGLSFHSSLPWDIDPVEENSLQYPTWWPQVLIHSTKIMTKAFVIWSYSN
jgi:hypothetical protein